MMELLEKIENESILIKFFYVYREMGYLIRVGLNFFRERYRDVLFVVLYCLGDFEKKFFF